MDILIRDEHPEDAYAIWQLTKTAFQSNVHSVGGEAEIIEALRRGGALTISLVAVLEDEIVGQITFSPVTIDGRAQGWYGLGPVSVKPQVQGKGIGSALIREGLMRLEHAHGKGCVLLGDPVYYERFGFKNDPSLRYPSAPTEYFLALRLKGASLSGEVAYHQAFGAA